MHDRISHDHNRYVDYVRNYLDVYNYTCIYNQLACIHNHLARKHIYFACISIQVYIYTYLSGIYKYQVYIHIFTRSCMHIQVHIWYMCLLSNVACESAALLPSLISCKIITCNYMYTWFCMHARRVYVRARWYKHAKWSCKHAISLCIHVYLNMYTCNVIMYTCKIIIYIYIHAR